MFNSDVLRQKDQLEFVAFSAGAQQFCIDIQQIREIRRWSPVTVLPQKPLHVLGVMNLRGAVIPIIDLATKLGFAQTVPSERHAIIIVAIGDQITGLLVESVSEILGVSPETIKDAPSMPENDTLASVNGIIPGDGDMTQVLNLAALFAPSVASAT